MERKTITMQDELQRNGKKTFKVCGDNWRHIGLCNRLFVAAIRLSSRIEDCTILVKCE